MPVGHTLQVLEAQYEYPPLFKRSRSATSLLWKTYIGNCFLQKKSEEDFYFYKKNAKIKNNIQRLFCSQSL